MRISLLFPDKKFHKPKPIDKIAALMRPKLGALVGPLGERSERLADLIESTKDIQADLETTHLTQLHLLHQTRDVHVCTP